MAGSRFAAVVVHVFVAGSVAEEASDSLMLLQTRVNRLESSFDVEAKPEHVGHDDAPAAYGTLRNAGLDCFQSCNRRPGGYCSWCGAGNACCRKGWVSNSSAECDGAAFIGHKHECVAPGKQTYSLDANTSCGMCGGSINSLLIGAGGHDSDAATRPTALEVCAANCDKHRECGGFHYIEESKRCFYRRATKCQSSSKVGHDCYTKQQLEVADAELIAEEEGLVNKLKQVVANNTRDMLYALKKISEAQTLLQVKGPALVSMIDEASKHAADLAELNERGYDALTMLKNNAGMSKYVMRILDTLNCKISKEGGLEGFVPHFSGAIASKTFDKLQTELREVCMMPDGWLTPKARAELESSHMVELNASAVNASSASQPSQLSTANNSTSKH